MTRRLAWLALTAALLGCKSAAPPGTDPFFGRTTVPPPATGAAAIPGFAQPGALQPGLTPATSTNGQLGGSTPSWGNPAIGPSSGSSPYANGLPYGNNSGGSPASPGGYPQPSTNANTASWPWVPPAGSTNARPSASNGNASWGGLGATSSAPNWGQAGQPASTNNLWNGNAWTQTPANRYGSTPPATSPGTSSGPISSPAGAWPNGAPGTGVSPSGATARPGGLTPFSPPADGMRGASVAPHYGQNNANPTSAPAWNPNAASADARQGPWPAQPAVPVTARPLGSFVGAPLDGRNEAGPTASGVSGRPVTNDPTSVVLSRDPIVRTISSPPRDANRSPGATPDAAGPGSGAWAATAPSQAPVSPGGAARGTPARTNILDLPDIDGSPSTTRAGANESNYRSAATAPAYGAAVGPRTSGEDATATGGSVAALAANGTGTANQAVFGGSATSATSTGQKTNFKADAPFGYDTNYQWLRGRLENNGSASTWRVAYVPPYAPADQFGGVLPMANPTALGGYAPGQQVEVRGRLVRVWSRGTLIHAFYVTEVQRIDPQ